MADLTKAGWRLVRVGAARRPEILYTCEACGTVTYFPFGSFVGLPDPKCCNGYRDYPSGKKVFDEFLTAKPISAESEAELVGVNVELSAQSSRPRPRIIALVASHRGRKRK